MDKVRDEVLRRYGSKLSIDGRVDTNLFRWYGHVESMEGEMMFTSVYKVMWMLVEEWEGRN
jgi:hypothetical protein